MNWSEVWPLAVGITGGLMVGDAIRFLVRAAWGRILSWHWRRKYNLGPGEGIGQMLAGPQEKVFKGMKGGL